MNTTAATAAKSTDTPVPATTAAPTPPAPAKVKKPAPPEPAAKPAGGKKAAVTAKPAAPKPAKAGKAAAPVPAKKATTSWPVPPAGKSKPPATPARPKAKLVRDSFTMPQSDFDLIATLKDRALGFKRPTKKSELLRAGLQVLAGLPVDSLKAALERLAPLKTGRPKKND